MKTDPKSEAASKKVPLHLIPPALNAEVATALACGAAKYGAFNWRSAHPELMTYLGAMRRHIDAVLDGQDIDPESGAHHLGHVAAGCAIVLDARKHGTLVDNRPKAAPPSPEETPAAPGEKICNRCRKKIHGVPPISSSQLNCCRRCYFEIGREISARKKAERVMG